MSSPVSSQVDSIKDIESGQPIDLSKKETSWRGRDVTRIPPSHEDDDQGCIGLCWCCSMVATVAGAIMWGTCASGSECHTAGPIVFGAGLVLGAIICISQIGMGCSEGGWRCCGQQL